MKLGLLVALVTVSVIAVSAKIQCKDQNNQNVDWFIFYKYPRETSDKNPHIANGTAFEYLDAKNKQWVLSPVGMEDENHAIAYTLKQFYDSLADNSTFSVLYNDEFPNSTVWSNDSGHTKGGAVFDSQSGFWLIHSIPKFPSNQSYEFPSNAHAYGQMGICVSFAYDSLGAVGIQLFYNRLFIYYFNLPTQMANDNPILKLLGQGLYQTNPPYTSKQELKSLGGQAFTSFAKTGNWGHDLYFDLVAPTLQTSLNVESWSHDDTQNLHSWCNADNSADAIDVSKISTPFLNFTNYDDHSKFAVAVDMTGSGQKPPAWVCVGDINRQSHQMQRGGGTMCIKDQALYDVFNPMIAATYPCNGTHYNL